MDKGRFAWSCFTYQQAANAALKSILSKMGESTFGENMIAIIRKINNDYSVPKDVEEACHQINNHFKNCRDLERKTYGIPSEHYTLEDAKESKSLALKILRYTHHALN